MSTPSARVLELWLEKKNRLWMNWEPGRCATPVTGQSQSAAKEARRARWRRAAGKEGGESMRGLAVGPRLPERGRLPRTSTLAPAAPLAASGWSPSPALATSWLLHQPLRGRRPPHAAAKTSWLPVALSAASSIPPAQAERKGNPFPDLVTDGTEVQIAPARTWPSGEVPHP